MLEQVAHFNDLSPKLRQKLQDRIDSFGNEVKYRFDISHENPDPEKYNGKIIWPSVYTLDPVIFDIIDQDEDRKDKPKRKKVGIVGKVDEKGIPTHFVRIRVKAHSEGVLTLDLTNPDDIEQCALLELAPKVNGSLFQNEKLIPIVSRINIEAEAEQSRKRRRSRAQALKAAADMTDQQVREFSAAMVWDENQKPSILRDEVEKHAELYPDLFNDLVSSDKLKYQSVIKMALTKGVLSYDPVSGRWFYGASQELITVLPPVGSQNHVEQMGEFLMTNGKKGDQIFDKIKALTKV